MTTSWVKRVSVWPDPAPLRDGFSSILIVFVQNHRICVMNCRSLKTMSSFSIKTLLLGFFFIIFYNFFFISSFGCTSVKLGFGVLICISGCVCVTIYVCVCNEQSWHGRQRNWLFNQFFSFVAIVSLTE